MSIEGKKGLGGWIEVARGGKHRAMDGKEHDVDALIDKAVATYDPGFHEAPAVIGHPVDNAPAYGWVESLRATVRNGAKVLEAKFRQTAPGFVEAVKDGRFKKRSAAFYPDGRLRHVGFLGAVPPAIKGLADVAFSDEAAGTIVIEFGEFSGYRLARMLGDTFRSLRDWLIEEKGVEKADALLPDWRITSLTEMGMEPENTGSPAFYEPGGKEKEKMNWKDLFKTKMEEVVASMPDEGQPAAVQFSEADVAAKVKAAAEDAAKKAKEEATAEFAEAQAKAKADADKTRIKVFIEDGVQAGRISPAMRDSGLAQFMEGLVPAGVIEFAEGKKATPLDWFLEFAGTWPQVIEFSEIAPRDKDVRGGNAGEKLNRLVLAKMEKDPGKSYQIAFSEAQAENLDLAKEYAAEIL